MKPLLSVRLGRKKKRSCPRTRCATSVTEKGVRVELLVLEGQASEALLIFRLRVLYTLWLGKFGVERDRWEPRRTR